MSFAEGYDATITSDPYAATLLLRALIADARDKLINSRDAAERLAILRDFVAMAQPETEIVGSWMCAELFTLLKMAVSP